MSLHTASADWANASDDQTTPITPEAPETTAPETSLPPAGGEAPGSAGMAAHEAATAAGDAAAEAATASGATPAEAEAARAAAMLKAFRGDEVVELDGALEIPLTDDGRERMTLAELRRSGLRTADYTRKTQQVAEFRRSLEEREREVQRLVARLDARQRALDAEAERLQKANSDPEAYSRFIEHQQRLADDPEYRQMYERSMRQLEREALDAADEEITRAAELEAVQSDIIETAHTFAADPRYAGVDVQRALAIYGARLQAGAAELKESHLRRVFEEMAAERQQVLAPVLQQVSALQQQLEELKAAQSTRESNARTRSAAAPRRATPAPVPTGTAASPTSSESARTGTRRGSFHEASQRWARNE
jgi:hypothetical protein